MKSIKLYVMIAVLILVSLGAMPVLAEDIKPDMVFRFSPKFGYNPIEEWRLGGQVKLDYIFGWDTLQWYGGYSFHKKSVHSGLEYVYKHDTYQFYTKLAYDMKSGGIYSGTTLWQDTRSIALGATKVDFPMGEGYYYIGNLMVQYKERTPANAPGGLVFSTGKNISIEPSLVGFYKGYLGSLGLAYGFPTQISDYHYFKADAYLKKVVKLTSKDRIVLSTEAGMVRGEYPVQENFFLGSSISNLTPDSKEKALSIMATENPNVPMPGISLDGFADNAFHGKNLFAGKIEYQHAFDEVDWPYAVYPIAKVYTVFGNAWDGDLKTGLTNTNAAVGIGVNFESHMFSRLGTDNWYFGVNLARGFGEHAATTVGFDLGMDLSLLNF